MTMIMTTQRFSSIVRMFLRFLMTWFQAKRFGGIVIFTNMKNVNGGRPFLGYFHFSSYFVADIFLYSNRKIYVF